MQSLAPASVALTLLVLIATLAAAAPQELQSPEDAEFSGFTVRSEKGRRLSAPAMQEVLGSRGFTLQAVHAHRLEADGTLVHTRFSVLPPLTPPARRLGTGRWASRRQLVRDLKSLACIAYTINHPYLPDIMNAMIADHDSLFGANIHTYEEEVAAETAAFNLLKETLQALGNVSVQDGGSGIDASGLKSSGVHALEFHAAGLGAVLAFRGTFSKGDFANIQPWLAPWILSSMGAQLKHQWTNISGLPWSEQMRSDSAELDGESRLAIWAGSWHSSSSFKSQLTDLGKAKGFSQDKLDKIAKTGYWEFTKMIAESAKSSLAVGEDFYITGHSQGGARAALASMYLEKQYNMKYQTVTFGGVGGLCFSRDIAYTSGKMTPEVDPYIMHDQITEYVHALDVYGHFDVDPGNVCIYGTTNITESAAAKYCAHVFGHSGPDLMIAGVSGYKKELQTEFKRCRYFTHDWYAVDRNIENDAYLGEDGTTDGGCTMRTAIPENDPNGGCPTLADGLTEGCNSARSCGVCGLSTSGMLNVGCSWCESSKQCRSLSSTWFSSCDGGWEANCGEASHATRAGGLYTTIVGLVLVTALIF